MTRTYFLLSVVAVAVCAGVAKSAAAETEALPRLLLFAVTAPGLAEQESLALSAALTDALAATEIYRVVGPSELATLLEFKGLTTSNCRDDACLSGLAETLESDFIVSANVGRVGAAFVLTARLIDVGAHTVVARAAVTATDAGALGDDAATLVHQLTTGDTAAKAKPLEALGDGTTEVRVAVIGLEASEEFTDIAATLSQVATLELKSVAGFSVISQEDIKTMLAFEAQKQLLGCDDVACLAEIGGALGVEYLLAGSLGLVGDTYLLDLRLLRIEDASTARHVAESFFGPREQLVAAARYATRALVGHPPTGSGEVEVRPSTDAEGELLVDGTGLPLSGRHAVEAGKHNLRLSIDGYHPWVADVYVEPGDLTRLDVTLTALPRPWYREWWLWTGVGAVVVGGAALGLYYGLRNDTGRVEITAPLPVPGG